MAEAVLRPLLLHIAEDAELDMDAIKAAKATLDLSFRVKPVEATEHDRGRILAIGAKPTWLCDFFLVGERESAQRWLQALAWVLGEGDDDEATTLADTMGAIFGEGTREITAAELAGERAWADYFAGF